VHKQDLFTVAKAHSQQVLLGHAQDLVEIGVVEHEQLDVTPVRVLVQKQVFNDSAFSNTVSL